MPWPEEEGRRMSAEAPRVYIYGIIRANEDGKEPIVPLLKGLAGNPVRTIGGDGLAALVSMLATPAAGTPFEESLKNPEQAKSLILDHHRVLQSLIDKRTVLPVRFGALFTDNDKVSDTLREHCHGILEAFERVEGAREWGLKIYCDRSVLRGHLCEGAPAMLAAQSELAAAKQGRAFFLQRQIARLGEEEAERAIARCIEASRERLCGAVRADASLKLQSADVHGRAGEMVWNGAFLVAKNAEERFFAMIGELLRIHGPHGFHYETTGPWPPFSFADCRFEEKQDGCRNGA